MKNMLYGNDEAILYYLDAGMLNYYAGDYHTSTTLLQDAERAIEEAYTKSITKLAASVINNDTSKTYDGEDYEDIYVNAFNALNYYHQGNMEDALVEIRRMNEKLAFLSDKYQDMAEKIQEEADKQDKKKIEAAEEAEKNRQNAVKEAEKLGIVLTEVPSFPDVQLAADDLRSSKYANSALGRYLGMLFYRGAKNEDDARIDHDWLRAAYTNAPEIYDFPVPSSIDEELFIPAGKARLNIIGFSGLSPLKREQVTFIPLGNDNHIKIALPELEYRPTMIRRVEVVFDNGDSFDLEKLEDIESVIREVFKEKIGLIRLKTTIRASIKGGTSAVVSNVGDGLSKSNDAATALIGSILSLAGSVGQLAADISEKADLRASRFFPGDVYVGGITVDPGVYSFRVNYYDSTGTVISTTEKKDVRAGMGSLNLVETVCLK
jgi:hypothetical protein